jgi:hypothetical protein
MKTDEKDTNLEVRYLHDGYGNNMILLKLVVFFPFSFSRGDFLSPLRCVHVTPVENH